MDKFIDSVVVHRIFGKGTVSALTDKKITVKFASCEKESEYPEAFEKFLKCVDEKIQKQILELVDENNRRKEEEVRMAEEADQLRFWNFYRNSGNIERVQWGTGLFRYISDEIAANILKRA